MSPFPEARSFPTLVLCLGEPHPGGLADVLRRGLEEELERSPAVSVRDLGHLRMAGVLDRPGGRVDPQLLERWAAGELADAVGRHPGRYPTPTPVMLVGVVVDAEDRLARDRALDALPALWRAARRLSVPAGLQPRLVLAVAWPSDRGPADAADRAAWVGDVEHLAVEARTLDVALVVGRSNYRPESGGNLRYLSRHERNRLIAAQLALLARSAVIEELTALTRGAPQNTWTALGHAPLNSSGDADPEAWPWLPAGTAVASRRPPEVEWLIPLEPHPARSGGPDPRAIAGWTRAATLVRCAYGIPSALLDGFSIWDRAYGEMKSGRPRRRYATFAGAPSPSAAAAAAAGDHEDFTP